MTTRHSSYIVVLEKDIREDDAENTIAALQRIKGVLTVEPVPAGVMGEHVGAMRERHYWQDRLLAMLREIR